MSYIEELFSLKGRKIVITGGAGAIPAEIAAGLAKAGADICLWGRGRSRPVNEAAKAVREAAGTGAGRIEALRVDTGDPAACGQAIVETEELIGPPDALVNGVGGNRGKAPFVEMDEELFREVVDLNLMAGLVTPTRAFARYWIDRGIQGNVIMMSSMTSYKPLSGIWAYSAAKSGVLNLTGGLARELAPHGIRVNGIAPGFFIGNQNRSLLLDEKSGGLTPRGQAIIDRTPFGRFGETAELRGAVIFLLSDRASGFITGVTIPVDGGYLTDTI